MTTINNSTYSKTGDAGLERQSQVGSVERKERPVHRRGDASLHRSGGDTAEEIRLAEGNRHLNYLGATHHKWQTLRQVPYNFDFAII